MKLAKLRKMLNKAAGQSVNAPIDDKDQSEMDVQWIRYVAEKGAWLAHMPEDKKEISNAIIWVVAIICGTIMVVMGKADGSFWL